MAVYLDKERQLGTLLQDLERHRDQAYLCGCHKYTQQRMAAVGTVLYPNTL